MHVVFAAARVGHTPEMEDGESTSLEKYMFPHHGFSRSTQPLREAAVDHKTQLVEPPIADSASVCLQKSSAVELAEPQSVDSSQTTVKYQLLPSETELPLHEKELLISSSSNHLPLQVSGMDVETKSSNSQIRLVDLVTSDKTELSETGKSPPECNSLGNKGQDTGAFFQTAVSKHVNQLETSQLKYLHSESSEPVLDDEMGLGVKLEEKMLKEPKDEHVSKSKALASEFNEGSDYSQPCPTVAQQYSDEHQSMCSSSLVDRMNHECIDIESDSVLSQTDKKGMDSSKYIFSQAEYSDDVFKIAESNNTDTDCVSEQVIQQEETLMGTELELLACDILHSEVAGQSQAMTSNEMSELPSSVSTVRNDITSPVLSLEEQTSSACHVYSEPAAAVEESGLSLATALKELHRLLVASNMQSSKTQLPNNEGSYQSTAISEECNSQEMDLSEQNAEDMYKFHATNDSQAGGCDTSERHLKASNSHMHSCLEMPVNSDAVCCDSDNQLLVLEETSKMAKTEKNFECSVTSDQQNYAVEVNIPPKTDSLPDLRDKDCKPSGDEYATESENAARDFIQGSQNSGIEVPLMSDCALCSDETAAPQSTLCESLEEQPVNPSGREETRQTFPQLSEFPAADVERITSSGFTVQEAVVALEQFSGNVDLALLVLLARKIVVPT